MVEEAISCMFDTDELEVEGMRSRGWIFRLYTYLHD